MAGSPFSKGGNAATAPAPQQAPAQAAPPAAAPAAPPAQRPAAQSAALPDAASVTNMGGDAPLGAPDPFAGGVADPAGIAGYKPGHFMDQLILMHCTEHGSMKTAYSTPEKPKQEFVKVDVVPLTLPAEFGFTNKFGEYEACEPFAVGDRLEDLLFFNGPLVREGKRMLDRQINWILGRITKGERKPNQDAPVIIVPATDEDKAIFAQWDAQRRAAAAQ